MNQVRRIAGAFEIVRSEHWEGGIVMENIARHGGVASVSAEGVQEVRIIEVCLILAYISEEVVEASFVGGGA